MNRDDWNRRYADAERLWTEEPNRFLVEELGGLRPGSALDVACGEGRNAVWLAQRGWKVDAVDFSSVALDRARRLAAARGVEVNWIEADLGGDAPGARRYDLVLVMYLQLPWGQMREVLGRAAAAVVPGGTFLLVGHDRVNLDRGHGGPKSPEVLYTPDDVAFELSNLEILEAARRERLVETETGDATAIDCLVRALAPA